MALTAVALSDQLLLTDALQKGQVFDAGGQRLTSAEYVSEVTVAEGLVHPLELRGGALVLRPGFLAQKKKMREQAPTTGIAGGESPELVNRLEGNYPNPFNPSTTLRFSLATSSEASLKIYDVRGRLVRTLVSDSLEPGRHEARWDGRTDSGSRAASGVYFARLSAGDFTQQHKIVMAR
jgi:hypothetical protein